MSLSEHVQKGRVGRWLGWALGLGALALLGGCAMDGPQVTVGPELAGPVARTQYDVFLVTLFVSLGIFLTVGSAMIFAVFRFRHRGEWGEEPLPPQTHGNAPLEVGLTATAILLVAIIAWPTLQGIVETQYLPAGADVHGVKIVVEGWQWWWNFKYPDHGVTTSNEMAIPVGRPVVVRLVSKDVIHSFWVPLLAGKTDVIPNQDNRMWLQADEPGIYYGQCTEYCGESHAFMKFRVLAMPEAQFQAWVEAQKTPDPLPEEGTLAARGLEIFTGEEGKCYTCHSIQGTPARGARAPDLTHLASRLTLAAGTLENNEANLRRWLTENHRIKPGNRMWFQPADARGRITSEIAPERQAVRSVAGSPGEIDALVAYLSTLRSPGIDSIVNGLKASKEK